ncbi:hypothetical protein BCV70DRAFT_43370 [Testicularia cyperi]|uniref:Uncharacterized protein n=1 Tax=Testicularia cyperi TaxID=1882483 RepID=A0A317XKV8_9BASI|nr:hypothetical protein BCV70DRAFT_43370 [Testicularia cyperi]
MSFLKKVQNNVAHTSKLPALGNQDLRSLQDVITSEKGFIQSNSRSATDFKKNAEALKTWAADQGDDLNDVCGKLSLLYDHYAASQNRLNSHLSTVRLHFKSVRTREEAFADLKARKRSLGSDIEKVEKKLAKMGPENKELMKVTAQLKDMRNEMENLRIEVMNEEAAIGDFKRRTVKEALGIKSGALLEMAEKLTILSEISKLMLEELPLQPTQPGMPRHEYFAYAKTESLLQEATRCIADVGFHPAGSSSGIPRFGDMTLADTTGNGSQDLSHRYGGGGADVLDRDVYHDFPSHTDANDVRADAGYSPPVNQGLSSEDVVRTPIYAAHASRSQWAQEATGAQGSLPADPVTNEWAQSSRNGDSPSAAAAAALAATAGADLNAVPGHNGDNSQRGGADGGFMMQNSASHAGSAGQGPYLGSNRNSADYQSAQGGHTSGLPVPPTLTVADPNNAAASTEGHNSDAYDGYAASSNNHQGQNAQQQASQQPTGAAAAAAVSAQSQGTAAGSTLGAPTLPPLRTATPLNDPVALAAANGNHGATASPVAAVSSPTTYANTATDDSAYFQSIGSTRAMQEAVRRPTSPSQNANRMSSYGNLGAPIGGVPAGPGGEGKKVTAAAFRRGFVRNPSSQANMTMPASGSGSGSGYDENLGSNPLPVPPSNLNPHAGLSTPVPPGGYLGTTPETESSVQPLHIQKRLSNSHNQPPQPQGGALGAAAAAGTPANMQGRRYSNDLNVSGTDHPAPPYLPDQNQTPIQNPHQYHQPPQHPGFQRQQSAQYAEYAAPPPPGYGYN